MFDTCSFKPTNDGFPPSSGGGGGAVTSVFGRTGVVIAVAGDYTSSEITNSSTVTGTYVTDALNTLDTGKLSTTLTNGNIIVGNGSNVATAVAMSGDATIINTGALTISNQAVTFAKMQHISSQHLVGRHAAGTGDIQQISLGTGLSFSGANLQVTGFVPTTLTSANIIVGNNLGVATAVAMSGDTTISNTGAVTISNDAVTTAKILNSNVTYAKIQNATTNRLIGRATAGAGVIEEITLGTNLSFTGTTLNAAGGGGYTYSAITLNGNVTYNKSDFAGANYINLSTNDASTRQLTIGTGFSANDFLVLNFNQLSPGSITLIIGGDTFSFNLGNSILAVYDGTNWNLSSLANAFNTSGATNRTLALGFGTGGAAGSDNTMIGNGNTYGNGSVSVLVGSNNVSSGVINSVLVGSGSRAVTNGVIIGQGFTGADTGVVAIGQAIANSNTDAVVIGRAAACGVSSGVVIGAGANGGSAASNIVAIGAAAITTGASDSIAIGTSARATGSSSVSIGSGTTGAGANTVRIGSGTQTGLTARVVAIGQGITAVGADAVIIGRAAGGGSSDISIGAGSVGAGGSNNIRIGQNINTTTDANLIAIGSSQSGSCQTGIRIGNGAGSAGTAFVQLGNYSRATGAANYYTILGYYGETNAKSHTIVKGNAAYARHYGVETRRLDTTVTGGDPTTLSRHSENTAWIGTTPDATPKILTLFDVADERLTLQDNEALHFDIMITAKQNGSTNTLVRRIAGGAVRGSGVGTTTIVGQTTLYTHGTALTTTVSADTINGAVQIQVTGNANTWQWTGLVNYQRTRTA
jgi:hypothetical protein